MIIEFKGSIINTKMIYHVGEIEQTDIDTDYWPLNCGYNFKINNECIISVYGESKSMDDRREQQRRFNNLKENLLAEITEARNNIIAAMVKGI